MDACSANTKQKCRDMEAITETSRKPIKREKTSIVSGEVRRTSVLRRSRIDPQDKTSIVSAQKEEKAGSDRREGVAALVQE